MRDRLRIARWTRDEVAGSLGDLGTFLPLLVGMASQNGLNFASALFFAGVFNVVTGLMFAIPMAVQPMKAIAAVALTEGLTPPQILAAGASVSAVVLVLGLTGGITLLHRWTPLSVIRGLQLSLGLSLLMKGLQMALIAKSDPGGDSRLVGLAALGVVLLLYTSRRFPPTLLLFAVGLALAGWRHPEAWQAAQLGLTWPRWSPPGLHDFITAFPRAALPQIPLTTLNSVLAVCALSRDLFPDRPATPRKVAVSVGVMNLTSCWFGGMPMCHGAGGLAGQYRFGARTNGAVLMLGAAKIVLAVLCGQSLMALCQAFPASILGVMLAFAGLELALVCRDQTSRSDYFVMLATVGLCLGLENIAVGFCGGCVLAWGLQRGWLRTDDGIAPRVERP